MGDLFDPNAFALGMVALINPCGFALLPAYLGFFLGLDAEDDDQSRLVALNRAQVVGLTMSVGFLAVFALLGLVFAGIGNTIQANPWITAIIGSGLVLLGIAMVFGFQPLVKIPKLEKGTGSRSLGSMFLFGVSYAVASLSCTIGLFLGAVGTSSSGARFGERFGGLVSYGLGMGLLASVLTLAVAFGKRGIVARFRQMLPHINRISAVLLIVVGIYVVLYGIWATQILNDPRNVTGWIDSIVTNAESFQASLTNWVDQRTTILGVTFLAVNGGLILAGLVARASSGRPRGATLGS